MGGDSVDVNEQCVSNEGDTIVYPPSEIKLYIGGREVNLDSIDHVSDEDKE